VIDVRKKQVRRSNCRKEIHARLEGGTDMTEQRDYDDEQ